MYNLNTLRANEFPQSADGIYFNHAAISPLPQRTLQAATAVAEALAANPSDYFKTNFMSTNEAFQASAATLINADHPGEIVAVPNTSLGINFLAQALAWQPGDNLLICETEFPANVYPWQSLERDGVEVRKVPAVDGGLTLAQLAPLVDERTRLVSASAVQFLTGHRTDLTAIGQFCHERGILFVVDAIQAIGHVPIDVQAMHIDALVTGGQKSLLGLPGCGFMFVRTAVAEAANPRIIGGISTVDYLHWLHYDMTLRPAAERFESGTGNLIGVAAMQASLQLLLELGVANIDAHTSDLACHAHQRLTEIGRRVITPADRIGPIVTWHSERSSEETDALVTAVGERGVTVGKHLDGPGNAYVRASFHCYNTREEVDRFIEVLQEI